MIKQPNINKKKYVFLPYSPKYPSMFLNEKKKIEKVLGKNIRIEHVGSTSIPNLGGKGIIDIAIKSPKNKFSQLTKRLEKIGYRYNPAHPGDSRRRFLEKITNYSGKERRVHVHLCLSQKYFNSFIIFRDYLKTNKKECERYAEIKKAAVKHAKGEGKKYREYKNKFLEKAMEKLR